MLKIVIAAAALAIISFSVPTTQANAATVVIKKDRGHDRDWGRRHHPKKIVVIKRGHRDHY